MKTYFKTIFRSFKNNISRFIAITLIVLIGSVFVSGLGTLTYTIEDSLSSEFIKNNGADIVLKSITEEGFNQEDIDEIASLEEIKGIKKVTCIDIDTTRIIISDMDEQEYNILSLVDGKMINDKNQIMSDRTIPEIGKEVTFLNNTFEVVGTIANPLIYSTSAEINNNEEEIIHYYYLDTNYFEMSTFLPITDLYISMNFSDSYSIFNEEYQVKVDDLKEKIESQYNALALTYNESISYNLVVNYSEKIDILCLIFPSFFLLVSCLVVLSTMTRMIEEERSQIGCYVSLGFSKKFILIRYLLFSFTCCLIGSILGIFIGVYGVPSLLYNVFNSVYFMPKISPNRIYTAGIIGTIITIISVLFVSAYVTLKELKERPSNLLRNKAPRAGRKILLEKINFIWKKLKFKYKSTFRNIFRYKKNLIMTIISVSGSTALILAGCGLYEIATSESSNIPSNMSSSFASISSVIIIFAGALSMLVIYNLTNMNIGERHREIASLRVLGYHNREVCAYIYREILIMTIFGIIFGLPLGYGLLSFLIEFIGFGSHQDITIISYLLTIVLVIVFVLLVDAILFKRIKNIDMNNSLKTTD